MMEPIKKADGSKITKRNLQFVKTPLEEWKSALPAICWGVCDWRPGYTPACSECPVNKVFHAIRNELLDIDEMLHWYEVKEQRELGLE